MRLNHDLIRLILLEAEDEEPVDLSPYSEEQIAYHKAQLIEAGYVKGFIHVGLGGMIGADVEDLTWAGHQFLANARNELFWKKAMRQLAKAGGSASIDIISALLAKVASSMLLN
ncbi:MAG: DUF2513 domain-containing protein [Anaerolineae bacterium]|nr:DUF2513 domain-containing protein [Anaerolineae bacterium]